MLEIEQLQHHIDRRFDSLEKTMSRIGEITDNNANAISGLIKTSEFLEKSIEAEKLACQAQNKLNQADFDRLYDRVSKRVKISTLYWVVGIAVTIMGVLSPIVAQIISK